MAVAEHEDNAPMPKLGQVDGLVQGALNLQLDGSDLVSPKSW